MQERAKIYVLSLKLIASKLP